ncbi:MAG: hypothetical protein GWQ05_25255 [Verrucomicrobiaceae bacterium]|nr:hypothetical protein [Verrucomicrobiaceae bacterium]
MKTEANAHLAVIERGIVFHDGCVIGFLRRRNRQRIVFQINLLDAFGAPLAIRPPTIANLLFGVVGFLAVEVILKEKLIGERTLGSENGECQEHRKPHLEERKADAFIQA